MEPIRGAKHLPGSPSRGLVSRYWRGGGKEAGWWGAVGRVEGRPGRALQLYVPHALAPLPSAAPQPSPPQPTAFHSFSCLPEPTVIHFWVLLRAGVGWRGKDVALEPAPPAPPPQRSGL